MPWSIIVSENCFQWSRCEPILSKFWIVDKSHWFWIRSKVIIFLPETGRIYWHDELLFAGWRQMMWVCLSMLVHILMLHHTWLEESWGLMRFLLKTSFVQLLSLISPNRLCESFEFLLFRKGSLRAGAKPRITDSPFVRPFVRVCLDRNKTLNLLHRF